MTLVEFLRARYEEAMTWVNAHDWAELCQECSFGHPEGPYSRAALLADIAAKRAILDRCEWAMVDEVTSGAALGETVLGLLAEPFADRPDFLPEWRVST